VNDYGALSFWHGAVSDRLEPRRPLPGDTDVDVAIVGGGYTGLWTAYALAEADPSLRIALIEKEICGFGASGRNGGWCSGSISASRERIARQHGRQAAIDLQRAMHATVDEIGRVIDTEGIDAHYVKGGMLTFARNRAQRTRLLESIDYERSWGFGEADVRWLDADEAATQVDVAGQLGGVFNEHCARVHPARLVRGLADAVERRPNVAVYEGTEAEELGDGIVRTPYGKVRAEVVVRAVEGYTPTLPGLRRAIAPIYSLMIATEPLSGEFWDAAGWAGCEAISDARHLIIYAQRTADDRIALGGRGAPYHYGSRVEPGFDREPRVFDALHGVLADLFPPLHSVAVTRGWGGPLAVPRDWQTSVGLDRDRRVAWAGGYVGYGVATSNLAGRCLADLILERDTELVRLPWVGHRSRAWEPEPLRWLGVNVALRGMAAGDRTEARTGKPSKRAAFVNRMIGH